MASLSVRRRCCLLRLRENCPFRKLRRQTHALSTIGSYWDNVVQPISNQTISTVCSQSLPPLSNICHYSQSEDAADVYMEDNPPAAVTQQNQSRTEDSMDLNVDPETGERTDLG